MIHCFRLHQKPKLKNSVDIDTFLCKIREEIRCEYQSMIDSLYNFGKNNEFQENIVDDYSVKQIGMIDNIVLSQETID